MRLLILLFLPSLAAAQSARGGASIDGFVFDSIRRAPLSGASIRLARAGATTERGTGNGSGQWVQSDSAGRFRITGLSAGRHELSFRHPVLDSLGVPVASRSVTLAEGVETYVDLGVPSARTLLSALCPRNSSEMNGVLGVVRDAETDAPVPRASVRISWSVIVIDRQAGVLRQPEFRGASSDASGLYVICDAPPDLDVTTVVAFATDYELAETESSFDPDGVAVQHVYLSRRNAPPTTVVGTVLDEQGAPIEGADVMARDTTAGAARTNAHGMFALGPLRPGTQMIEIRRLGFQRTRRPVSLPAGRDVTLDPIVLPTMIARMPEITVREKSTAEQFGFHDRRNVGRGRFLTREEIARHKQVLRSSDLIRELIPGMRLEMKSGQMVITNESLRQNIKGETCAMPMYIDGVPAPTDLALDIVPADIDGMEIYNAPEMVPAEFSMRSADGSAPCGAILIWTTWRNRKTPGKP